MKLQDQQSIFTRNSALFVLWVFGHDGWTLTDGESFRPLEVAKLDAMKGIGIVNTLHGKRLAHDYNFFINGVYQQESKAYAPLGAFWKSMHPLNRWGGDFSKPDGNHFSMEYQGVK